MRKCRPSLVGPLPRRSRRKFSSCSRAEVEHRVLLHRLRYRQRLVTLFVERLVLQFSRALLGGPFAAILAAKVSLAILELRDAERLVVRCALLGGPFLEGPLAADSFAV